MPKKKAVRKPVAAPPVRVSIADLKEHYRDQAERCLKLNQDLDAVSPDVLKAIVGDGVLDSEIIHDVSIILANRLYGMANYKQALDAFYSRLESLGVSLGVPHPDVDDRPNIHLTDLTFEYALAYARASYLLGVAVGRQMGGAR